MLQISDVRASWACLKLAKQITQIKIRMSTINERKKCCLLGPGHSSIRIKLDNNKNHLYLSQQQESKTEIHMPLTIYILQVSFKIEVLMLNKLNDAIKRGSGE